MLWLLLATACFVASALTARDSARGTGLLALGLACVAVAGWH